MMPSASTDIGTGSAKQDSFSELPDGVDTASSLSGTGYGSIERGISLWSFLATAVNAMVTLGLSIPFMFTTAGLLSIPLQVIATASAFICTLLVRSCLDDQKVLKYAEDNRVPPFEREYSFLAGYCRGTLGRTTVTVVVSLEYFFTLSANIIALAYCARILVDQISIDLWIIIFSVSSLLIVLLPWLKHITHVMSIAGGCGAALGAALWVWASIMVLPETNFEANVLPKEPYASSVVTALAIAVFSSGAPPSLPPFYGVIKNASAKKVNYCILLSQVVAVLYILMLGIAGMQICEGTCDQFYIMEILKYPSSVIPLWFTYLIVAVQLLRIFSLTPVLLVPIIVSSEGMLASLLQRVAPGSNITEGRVWRYIWRSALVAAVALVSVAAREELAYVQAITGTLLCSCNLLLFPLGFYLLIKKPEGLNYALTWTGIVFVVTFAFGGTVFAILQMLA